MLALNVKIVYFAFVTRNVANRGQHLRLSVDKLAV